MASPAPYIDVAGNATVPSDFLRRYVPLPEPPGSAVYYGTGTEERLDPPTVRYLD